MDAGQFAQIATILAQNGDESGGGSLLTLLLPLLLLGGVAYFLLIRPQQKRAQQHQRLVSELEPGDEVVTIGGMLGDIVEIDDDRVTLEMYDGTQIEFIRTAISRKVAPEREEAESGSDDSEDFEDEAADESKDDGAEASDKKSEK